MRYFARASLDQDRTRAAWLNCLVREVLKRRLQIFLQLEPEVIINSLDYVGSSLDQLLRPSVLLEHDLDFFAI